MKYSTISGAGIANNSGALQVFLTGSDLAGHGGQIRFTNSSTAGNAFIDNASDDVTNFFKRSTASTSSIYIEGGGSTNFFNRSTASTSDIFNEGGASTNFFNMSTADRATIHSVNGSVMFADSSTAGNAFIGVLGTGPVSFTNTSTAGNAFIATTGYVEFVESSRGGTARVGLFCECDPGYFGSLGISRHNAPGVTIGSIEGVQGTTVYLGANNLTVGSNNLSTTFAGSIEGTGGSLTKVGTGTLDLTGVNTYTGNTNVNRGVLQVDGSITSNTFVNHGGTLAGIGTINGNVTNSGRVSPGALGVPGMLTVVHNYTQTQYATLMIQTAGANSGDFSVLNVLGNANLNGYLNPVLLNGFVPTIGDSFTFLNYASFTGEFSHIKHRVFGNGTLQWSVIYEANHAILTVEQHVPDQGSTFLLLTLGLLGLVAYRRQLRRGAS